MRSITSDDLPIAAEEGYRAFARLPRLQDQAGIVLAVSGGPDSTALMGLYAEARRFGRLPPAVVVTVDHRLREGSGAEAQSVAEAAASLGFEHALLTWTGAVTATAIQAKAREARYRLMADFARQTGRTAILTGHTRDDQAETVLMRLARGSGLKGLGGMDAVTLLAGVDVYRPLLQTAKTRLIETCRDRNWTYVRDPSNSHAGFLRARLRKLAPALAREGLTAPRLARFAERMRRADEALDAEALRVLERGRIWGRDVTVYDAGVVAGQHAEIVVRIFQHVIGMGQLASGTQAAPRLERIEALAADFQRAVQEGLTFRRNAGGVLFTLRNGELTLRSEPARRSLPLTTTAETSARRLARPNWTPT